MMSQSITTALRAPTASEIAQARTRKVARRLLKGGLAHAVTIAILTFSVFPFYWALACTLKPSTKLYSLIPTFIPDPVTLDNFVWALSQETFLKTLRNSLVVATITPVFALILTSMMAYSLARYSFPGKKVVFTALITTQMLPGVLMIVPMFVVFVTIQRALGIQLVNTYGGLVIGFSVFSLPFATLLLRGFFANLPPELEEAAFIDGCNRFQAFVRVVLPLSIPGILTVGLFAFIEAWNDLLFAMVITSNTNAMTVAVSITQLMSTQYANTNYGGILAEGVIITVPIVIIFVLLQKYLVEGMTAGAIKG